MEKEKNNNSQVTGRGGQLSRTYWFNKAVYDVIAIKKRQMRDKENGE